MLKKFEKEIIEMMTKEILSSELIEKLLSMEEIDYYTTGNGYFLTIADENIPRNRIVINKPIICAKNKGIETGFIIFIENNELTLECHSWGDDIPLDYRDGEIFLSFPEI